MNKHLWDVHDVHACFKREEAAVAEVHDNSGGGTTSLSPPLFSASISSNSNA